MTWIDDTHENLRSGIREDMEQKLTATEQRLITRIEALDDRLSARIAELDEKFASRIAALDEKLTERIHRVDLRVEQSKAELMRWSFVFWVGAVTAIAVLAGVLRP